MKEIHRNNHYVPQTYLKQWSADGHKVWCYGLLVSHKDVPLWRLRSIRGIAYHSHLYTKRTLEGDSDELERWLDKEFEAPAEGAIIKATTGRRLTPEDWENLIRFTAAQCVRTPAWLVQGLERWKVEMPDVLNTTLQEVVKNLENGGLGINNNSNKNTDVIEYLPIHVIRESSPDTDKDILKVETIVGRGMWLFSIKHILTNTIKVLLQHKWSIMKADDAIKWITSDDPVIRLNYFGNGKYDFGGGWGREGSEILLPLSPKYMLYTMVGKKSEPRINLSYTTSSELFHIIAKHSDRCIYAYEPIKDIEEIRPRIVNPIAYKHESESWSKWHEEQSISEKEYMRKDKV
jgi:hypothetical protein